MSYDFAVLLPETVGPDDADALTAAIAVFEGESVVSAGADPRLLSFLTDLEAAGAADDDSGWVSVWPLHAGADGLAVPTTYGNVDDNHVVLLKIAARHGLVLVDLSSQKVDRPGPGVPVGVKAGDGTRLGALTYRGLQSLIDGLPPSDPWIVLERDSEVYVQTFRQEDGTFLLEHRDGNADRHFRTTASDGHEVLTRMWSWAQEEPSWDASADWESVQF